MSVLIKGMEMPTNCDVCPFCDYASARCDAVKGTPHTPESRYEKRADFCPLVEIPPHGRLIDADKLKEEFPHDEDWDYPVNTNSYVVETIDKSSTIIEAEEGE